jgi:L-lactate utilization protein LutC
MSHRLEDHPVMRRVKEALSADKAAGQAHSTPTPPNHDQSITRLVNKQTPRQGLLDLFIKRATENKMHVRHILAHEVNSLGRIVGEILVSAGPVKIGICKSNLWDVAGSDGSFIQSLKSCGLEVIMAEQLTLDGCYDLEASVTDCFAAVAETGTVAVIGKQGHARALSLVPNIHLVVLPAERILPDLVDLMEEPDILQARAITMITGPSKTADIEMNLVVGVHGPGVVHVLVIG